MTAVVHTLRTDQRSRSGSLERFLADSEKRAYRTALLTTRKAADALDVVQEAMLKLVQHYRERPEEEWPLLFQRILQNAIVDWHREQFRRRRWFWTGSEGGADDLDDVDEAPGDPADNPAEIIARARSIAAVMTALEALPLRQRQAFLLRAWEGFDTAATAQAMGCSQGSVKTHFHRAAQTLQRVLNQS